jgi:hypothetical protein
VTIDQIAALLADVVTVIGLPLAVWALFVSRRDYQFARAATSAATLLSLQESFRTIWSEMRGAAAMPEDYDFHYAELLNLIEAACTVHAENLMQGKSREMLEAYLDQVIEILESDPQASQRLERLISHETTFSAIREYVSNARRRGRRRRPADLPTISPGHDQPNLSLPDTQSVANRDDPS